MKKKVTALSCISLLVILLSGCTKSRLLTEKVYTKEDMNHFYSDKVAIDNITNIEIESEYADFEIIASDNYYVEYSYYYLDNEPKLTIQDHTLKFSDARLNTKNQSINIKEDNYFKLYIPANNQFKAIEINKSSGDCSIGSFSTEKLSLSNHYGDTIIANCQTDKMDVDISSGNVNIKNSKIQEMDLKNTYGEVALDSINDSFRWMDSLDVKMSSGNLSLTNLYCKEMELENSYGTNEIENCAIGKMDGSFDSGDVTIKDSLADDINLENTYGNISMSLLGRKDDYRFNIQSEFGLVQIEDAAYEGNTVIDHGGKKSIDVKTSSGDTEIKFKEQ